MPQSVIYEVRLEIDAAIAAQFDEWLAGHVEEMLALEGFVSAEIVVPGDESESPVPPDPATAAVTAPADTRAAARVVRIVRYRVASRRQLERYFAGDAERMRQKGVQRFGDRFSATRQIYQTGKGRLRNCQNCDTPLAGQYCAACGQRDKNQVISLWELLRDLVGDLFELDSRVWRTLRPLLFKPGLLTVEYLRGRRVHYTPPLRLYLVTSLVFFLVVFFDTGPGLFGDLTLEVDEPPVATQEDTASAVGGDRPVTANETVAGDESAEDPDADDTPASDRCLSIEIDDQPWADPLERRAQHVCKRLTAEGGAAKFGRDLVDNIPGMMFFFLPAIALVMLLLYPFSRRYYVEHLLFFVHYHSFFFVILTITVLFSRLPAVLPGQGVASGLLTAATTVYLPVYLFVAMRRVYAQSRLLTALKYTLLGIAYIFGLLLTFAVVVLFTALSV